MVIQSKDALSIYEAGADKGCLECIERLMTYYSWVFGGKAFADREKSLMNFSLYFSLLDRPDNAEFLEKRKNSFQLQQYYYVYGVELDIDEKNKRPDKPLAMYYYKKCLECENNHKHWSKVLRIGTNYAIGNSEGLYYKDVPHSEEIAELCYSFFEEVYNKLKAENGEQEVANLLLECYGYILNEYKRGNVSGANKKEKIEKCQERIASIKRMIL